VAKDRTAQWRRMWDKQAPRYDKQMGFWDRHLFKDSRSWACGQARGTVLEVAIGTGLNLDHYPKDVTLIGVDFSPEMLALARHRSASLGREVDLREGDAQRLELPDASVDTVVCTFGLCAVPSERRALAEMHRVLRPGGRLVLADHVRARSAVGRAIQRAVEIGSVRFAGEHFRRRPGDDLDAIGFVIQRRERFGPSGIVERILAEKPAGS
jgi:ubiquinone/menaquinone biosynthesis C-methylase UbiE